MYSEAEIRRAIRPLLDKYGRHIDSSLRLPKLKYEKEIEY